MILYSEIDVLFENFRCFISILIIHSCQFPFLSIPHKCCSRGLSKKMTSSLLDSHTSNWHPHNFQAHHKFYLLRETFLECSTLHDPFYPLNHYIWNHTIKNSIILKYNETDSTNYRSHKKFKSHFNSHIIFSVFWLLVCLNSDLSSHLEFKL